MSTNATAIFPTVAAALQHAAQTRTGTAYIDRGREWSWQDMDVTSDRLAAQLQALGMSKGDRIGLLLLNQIEWLHAYFAAAKIGAVIVGMSARFRESELNHLLQDSQIKAVVTLGDIGGFDFGTFFAQAQARHPLLQHRIHVGPGAAPGSVLFPELLEPLPNGASLQPVQVAPDDLMIVIYTSGTTGRPKAAGITHRSQLASARAQQMHTGMGPDDVMQLAMPFNHVGGTTCGALAMLLGGGVCELVPAFSPDAILTMTRSRPPTLFVGVPTMITLMLTSPAFATANLRRVRLVIIGGSNVEAALLTKVQQALPQANIMNLYGLSESSGAIIMSPPDCSREDLLETIGTPLAGAELRIVGNDGRDVVAGEVGELWLRGAGVIPGYVGADRGEVGFDGAGWLHTGDLGRLNERGLVVLMGRQKDMYIQGGFNVYPAEVEGVIAQHPDVMMVAGIGVPDELLGEVGRYYIVPRPGSDLNEGLLRAFCESRLADYKRPRQIVIRLELPLTPAGKIHKAALRAS